MEKRQSQDKGVPYRVVPLVFPLFFALCAPLFIPVWSAGGYRMVEQHLGNHRQWLRHSDSFLPDLRAGCGPETRASALCSQVS